MFEASQAAPAEYIIQSFRTRQKRSREENHVDKKDAFANQGDNKTMRNEDADVDARSSKLRRIDAAIKSNNET